jgi:crossover junction endodeoxyribonuclease RuvC
VIVLGIDPGTASLGYGIVERRGPRLRMVDAGCLETPASAALPDRLLTIHRFLVDLIELHQPDLLAVERLFFSKNAQTAFAVGQARGVVLLAAAQAEVPVREATPNEVKVAVTGYGAADKEQVGRMVAVCLGLGEPPHADDTADALAIAIWAANAERPGAEEMRSSVLDRASVNPMTSNTGAGNSYERAVREAIARDKAAEGASRRKG